MIFKLTQNQIYGLYLGPYIVILDVYQFELGSGQAKYKK